MVHDSPGPPPTPDDDVLSIGDLARSTGLSVETIRMWERRYGRPRAIRLPSGHRRYARDEARWLRRIAEVVAHGTRPSDVVQASPEELDALLADAAPPPPADCESWLALARTFDIAAVRSRLHDEAKRVPARTFVAQVVAPLVAAMGRAWADGRMDIRHEHFLSHAILDELRSLRSNAAPRPGGPGMVFSTLPGERHGLGLEMASTVAAHAGARCVLLGADTPLTEIAAAAREVDADAVAVSVSVAHGGVDADRLLADLRALLSPWVRLIVGGAGTRRPRRAPRGIEYVEDFERFDESVARLRSRRTP